MRIYRNLSGSTRDHLLEYIIKSDASLVAHLISIVQLHLCSLVSISVESGNDRKVLKMVNVLQRFRNEAQGALQLTLALILTYIVIFVRWCVLFLYYLKSYFYCYYFFTWPNLLFCQTKQNLLNDCLIVHLFFNKFIHQSGATFS